MHKFALCSNSINGSFHQSRLFAVSISAQIGHCGFAISINQSLIHAQREISSYREEMHTISLNRLIFSITVRAHITF